MEPRERALPKLREAGASQSDPLAQVNAAAEGLLARLATYDPATALHCRRVATWSGNIATALDRSPGEIAFVERCGLLHDVGKLLTPLSLLRKTGPLTAGEWIRMQDHVIDGAELVGSIPVLLPYVAIVVAHHERLNGSGYPRGLAGEEIVLDARIVAVADAFDAMISGRPIVRRSGRFRHSMNSTAPAVLTSTRSSWMRSLRGSNRLGRNNRRRSRSVSPHSGFEQSSTCVLEVSLPENVFGPPPLL